MCLCCSFRKLSEDDMINLCQAVGKNNVLEELVLSGHEMSQAALEAFNDMLQGNKTLRKIGFGDARLGTDGLSRLMSGLTAANALELVDLELKGLSAGAQSGDVLGQIVMGCAKLQFVNVTRNSLDDTALERLSGHLCDWDGDVGSRPPVTILLRENSLTSSAAEPLGRILRSRFPLQRLDLSLNKIGCDGGVKLFTHPFGPSLNCLNLAG